MPALYLLPLVMPWLHPRSYHEGFSSGASLWRLLGMGAVFGATQETASASVQWQFSHYFANPTSLTLVEVKTTQATVVVPEPANTLALFCFGSIGVGLQFRSKLTRAKPEKFK